MARVAFHSVLAGGVSAVGPVRSIVPVIVSPLNAPLNDAVMVMVAPAAGDPRSTRLNCRLPTFCPDTSSTCGPDPGKVPPVVVVVGHSNTVAAVVAGLSASQPQVLCESTFSNLFVTTPGVPGAPALQLKYGKPDEAPAAGCQ